MKLEYGLLDSQDSDEILWFLTTVPLRLSVHARHCETCFQQFCFVRIEEVLKRNM